MQSVQDHKPVARFTSGAIQVAIWENESKEGKKYSTISLDKRYKAGDEWKSTNSMRQDEIPKAVLALQKAYEHLLLKDVIQTK